jgi:hypothetical protein
MSRAKAQRAQSEKNQGRPLMHFYPSTFASLTALREIYKIFADVTLSKELGNG